MPVPFQAPLEAKLRFGVPADKVDDPLSYFTSYDAERIWPSEDVVVPVRDLRTECDAEGNWKSPAEQVAERGFAAGVLETPWLDQIDTLEGIEGYITDMKAHFKEVFGCDDVACWNSVMRRNAPNTFVQQVEKRQPGLESNFVPSDRIKFIAPAVHVDQDAEYGLALCQKAIGPDVLERYSRAQVINLWRPVSEGPVTNAPLAAVDGRTLKPSHLVRLAGAFGTTYTVFPDEGQRWAYIQRQTSKEVLYLKCWDSARLATSYEEPKGEDFSTGIVPLSAHAVCHEIVGEEPVEGEHIPRTSLELRMVLLYN